MTLTWIKSQLWAVYKSTARAHKINIYKSLSWQWWSCLQSQKLGGWGTFTGSKLAPVQCDMPAPKTSTQLRTLSLGAVFKDRVADYSYALRTKQIRTQEADRNHSSLQPGVVAHTLVTAALKRGGRWSSVISRLDWSTLWAPARATLWDPVSTLLTALLCLLPYSRDSELWLGEERFSRHHL